MKAIVLTQYGLADALQLQDVEKPIPKADEVAIAVRATTLNDWDWCLMRGTPFYIRLFCGLRTPNVRIPGAEIAGRVEAVGSKVTKFEPGDAVYGDISEAGFGGFAEYVCIKENALALKPERMSFIEAAAMPHAAMLAIQGLRDEGHLQAGEKVLINGAGGGVGTLGIQLAKLMGAAEVTGVDSSDKFELMRTYGCDRVIDYQKEDFTAGGDRYDLILDTKTNRSLFKYLRVLHPNGRYVTVGGTTDRLSQTLLLGAPIRKFSNQDARIVTLNPNQDLEYVNELVEASKVHPAIDGPYQLEEIPKLIHYFGTGKHKGKVVITVGHEDGTT